MSFSNLFYRVRCSADHSAIERKSKSGGASAPSPAFVRLQDTLKALDTLISASRGRPNKDLAKLADQLRTIIEKWDA